MTKYFARSTEIRAVYFQMYSAGPAFFVLDFIKEAARSIPDATWNYTSGTNNTKGTLVFNIPGEEPMILQPGTYIALKQNKKLETYTVMEFEAKYAQEHIEPQRPFC